MLFLVAHLRRVLEILRHRDIDPAPVGGGLGQHLVHPELVGDLLDLFDGQ